jgi:hypothetical protein
MRLLLAVALSLLAGCSGVTGPDPMSVVLHVDEENVALSEPVTVRLVNASGHEVGYNLCRALLERQDGTSWHVAQQGTTCFDIMYVLRPGEQAAESRALPPETGPGVYRFRLAVRSNANRQEPDVILRSSGFEVR